MTDLVDIDSPSPNITDDEQPIAMRRKRRTSSGLSSRISLPPISRTHGISTPPTTPKRAKKRVRFSDPGPIFDSGTASSGLTPFIRRSTLSTPISKRRHSTPAKLWNLAENSLPISGTLQFEPMRQILDGRVKRRLRRNRLSEEANNIEGEKRHQAKVRRSEVEELRARLAAKDLEVQGLRDDRDIASQIEEASGESCGTNVALGTKVHQLEQQIVDLEAELERRETDTEDDPDWTLAAKDPFGFNDEEEDMMVMNYSLDFDMMNDEVMTTPTRLNTSFPSPPSTVPNTPCKSATSTDAGIQTALSISETEVDAFKTRLGSLLEEVTKLNSAIALNDDNHSRFASKLSDFIPAAESHDHSSLDSALDSVLTQLALSQSHAMEKENAFSALAVEITNLGFPASGPEEMLATIAQQFRQARLDLEYTTPGEVVEGFENDKLLDMLVSRVRILVEKVKERDQSIDQYHEQELLLRQQLNTRVDAQHDIQKELYLANTVVQDLRTEIDEREVSNERLQRALDGYRAELKGLETLIETLERNGARKEDTLRNHVNEVEERLQNEVLKHDTTRAADEGKDFMIVQLEQRLNAALSAASEVHQQMNNLSASAEAVIVEKDSIIERLRSASKSHGEALALRDARVSELRGEIERVNEALKTAHSTILSLRRDNNDLEVQIEGEKTRGQLVVQAMREQLNRVLETGLGYINGNVSTRRSVREGSAPPTVGDPEPQAVVRRGRFLDGGLARRSSGKKRRRYDSGLGFLEEEDNIDILLENEM